MTERRGSESADTSPLISAASSTAELIVTHDTDDHLFDLSDDTESDTDDEQFDPQLALRRPPQVPVLSTSNVFLYLLSPLLKLGALLLPHTALSLKYALPALFLFAILSAFVRQLWYMLARYLRKADLEEIIADAFARGRGKENRRNVLRFLIRLFTGTLRILMAVLYLREATHMLLPLVPTREERSTPPLISIILCLLIAPIYAAQTLGSKRVLYATWISVATYLFWLILVSISYAKGTLNASPGWLHKGTLWEGITTIAFAFSSAITLPLYSSLKGGFQAGTQKSQRSRSFRALSFISVALATCLMLPLVFYAALPNEPAPLQLQPLDPYIYATNALTVLLAIPSLLLTSPPLPIPSHVKHSAALSKNFTFIIVLLLSLATASVSGVLSDIVIAATLLSTYFLPAFIHITMHFFKRPLSIVIPTPATPRIPQQSSSGPNGDSTPNLAHDELLQRKERSLQRRQLRRRIIWDLGTWVLLVPVCGGGIVWAVVQLKGGWYN